MKKLRRLPLGGWRRRDRAPRRLRQRSRSAGTAMNADAMKTQNHTCSPEATSMMSKLLSSGESLDHDISTESVEEMRARLANMTRLMEENQGMTLGDLSARRRRNRNSDMIDGNFLSLIFGTALVVIIGVSAYAFYNLYNAVLKKFPTKHTEL